MEQIKDGFVYDEETKEIITEFKIGNEVYEGVDCAIFYGTKKEAIKNNLIFKDETENI